MFWTVVVFSLLLAAVTRVLWRRWNYDLHKIPSSPGLPFLGDVFSYREALEDPLRLMGKWLKSANYPKVLRLEIMGTTELVVTDDHFFKTVVLSARDNIPRSAEDMRHMLPIIGNNPKAKSLLLQTEMTPYTKAMRKIYMAAVQTNSLKAAMPQFQEVMQKMISAIESTRESGPVEVQNLCTCMTLDAIGIVAFGTNLGGLDKSSKLPDLLLKVGHVIHETSSNPLKALYCNLFSNSKAGRHRRTVINELNDEWRALTNEVLSREDPTSGEEPIWYGLKHLVDPDTQEPASQDLILAEIATVVLAGMGTTGHQLAWILAHLATRPDAVAKILKELEQNGLHGDNSRDLQYEDLATLSYLTAVIKEGMRASDVVPGLFTRVTPRDMTICGYRVPKGTRLGRLGNRPFNLDTDWDDPESFQPERWLRGDELRDKWNLMFSTGPRDCPGQKLAMLEIRLAIIALVQKYNLSLVGKFQDLVDNTVTGIVIEAAAGIWLNITPRATS